MEVKAILKTIRIAPRKVQLLVDLIQKKPIAVALALLDNTNKRSTEPLKKLIHSAVANAVNNNGISADKLSIKEVYVNDGPTLKRFRPSSHGRANKILKRTSHITVIVTDEKGW